MCNPSFHHNISLNPFPNKALVCMCLQFKSFENTVGKGEIACFHSVFYLFVELSAILIKTEIVVCKLFQLGRV